MNYNQRCDEEVRRDIIDVLSKCENVGENIKIITGIESIFMGFVRNNIDDIHPYYYFKAVVEIKNFSLNKTNCK